MNVNELRELLEESTKQLIELKAEKKSITKDYGERIKELDIKIVGTINELNALAPGNR